MHKQAESFCANRPRVTVAAVVERDGRFLLVEEHASNGELVVNQPAGHVESGETLQQAVIRETFEESAWRFRPEYLVGLYLWAHPGNGSSYLRVCFAGAVDAHQPDKPLDSGIERVLWLSRQDLAGPGVRTRSPLVLSVVDDYLAGERYPLSALKSLLP